MNKIERLPAFPLIASDPYLSVWMPADTMTQTDSCHWAGTEKPLRSAITVDETAYRFLGAGPEKEAELEELGITATRTRFVSRAGGVMIETAFITPALPDDPDVLSMPVTLVTFRMRSADGAPHRVSLRFHLSDKLCYDGAIRPKMRSGCYPLAGQATAWCGQQTQKPLCHSGDHITIDWGYLYLTGDGEAAPVGDGLQMNWAGTIGEETLVRAVIAYDDIASINYFGDFCKAWYRRDGAQITDAIAFAVRSFDDLMKRCGALDAQVYEHALKTGGEDYALLANAAWRQTFAAHKLIATPEKEMAFLSKENDSNGCIGTVDISYPSVPIMLCFAPELVNALCRPVLKFASMPVWTNDFAPHDVGRYPYATGQIYASAWDTRNGETHPPFYLYPAEENPYNLNKQMPVEESGNMLIMLAAARAYGASGELAAQYRPLLDRWARYLAENGEDPGEQLCTDDFAGHLAHNVNLAAKAMIGITCYGRMTGDAAYEKKAREMASRLLERIGDAGNTPITFDGQGWSMKYNLMWDQALGLNLLPENFYRAELESYLPRINRFGLPLDSRADYTKSDWICWVSAMTDDRNVRRTLYAPIVRMLRESTPRVAFTDWYDTKTGVYRAFIARSVQGGVYAPMLKDLRKPM